MSEHNNPRDADADEQVDDTADQRRLGDARLVAPARHDQWNCRKLTGDKARQRGGEKVFQVCIDANCAANADRRRGSR